MTVFGDGMFKELGLNAVRGVGPNQNDWHHHKRKKHWGGIHIDKKAMLGPTKKVAICKLSREASGESDLAGMLILGS
jgi:hypothetical protein